MNAENAGKIKILPIIMFSHSSESNIIIEWNS